MTSDGPHSGWSQRRSAVDRRHAAHGGGSPDTEHLRLSRRLGQQLIRLLMEVVVMTTSKTAGVYRRCGCIDQSGRRRGRRCPRLCDPTHGSWYFAVQVTRSGRRIRVRRGGYPTAHAARTARDAVLVTGDAGHGWTVAGWLRHWLSTLPGQVRPSTLVGYRRHVYQYLIPHLGGYRLAELTVAQIGEHQTLRESGGNSGSRAWTGRTRPCRCRTFPFAGRRSRSRRASGRPGR